MRNETKLDNMLTMRLLIIDNEPLQNIRIIITGMYACKLYIYKIEHNDVLLKWELQRDYHRAEMKLYYKISL